LQAHRQLRIGAIRYVDEATKHVAALDHGAHRERLQSVEIKTLRDVATIAPLRPEVSDAPIERVGAKFTPLPFAPVMEQFVVPHADDVLAAINRTVGKE